MALKILKKHLQQANKHEKVEKSLMQPEAGVDRRLSIPSSPLMSSPGSPVARWLVSSPFLPSNANEAVSVKDTFSNDDAVNKVAKDVVAGFKDVHEEINVPDPVPRSGPLPYEGSIVQVLCQPDVRSYGDDDEDEEIKEGIEMLEIVSAPADNSQRGNASNKFTSGSVVGVDAKVGPMKSPCLSSSPIVKVIKNKGVKNKKIKIVQVAPAKNADSIKEPIMMLTNSVRGKRRAASKLKKSSPRANATCSNQSHNDFTRLLISKLNGPLFLREEFDSLYSDPVAGEKIDEFLQDQMIYNPKFRDIFYSINL